MGPLDLPAANPDLPPGRPIDDPAVVRDAIFSRALDTVKAYQPITGTTHALQVSNPAYEGPERYSVNEQKRAIMEGRSLGRRLRADISLLDVASGKPISTKRTTVAQIPYYTDRGTFINNGTEYTLANQLRLRPGVYTREKDNGELEAHVNILPGEGVPHRIFLDPKSGIFRVKIGQAQIPIVALLHAMGVNQQQLRSAWGSELAATNVAKVASGDQTKLYNRLVKNPNTGDPDEQRKQITDALSATKLDPEVSVRTLGKPYANMSAEVILDTTRKLLAIQNRKNPEYLKRLGLEAADQDDRDHLAFMSLLGPEDVIAERLRAGTKLLRPLLWKAMRSQNLDSLAAGVLDKSVRSAILESGLGQASESINPAQVFEQQIRVSRMGVGGIPSSDAIPESSRSVQPSHLGFIDPVVTPESERAGVDSRLVRMLRKGTDGQVYVPFIDRKSGKTTWQSPRALYDSVIAFPGPMPPAPGQKMDVAAYQKFKAGIASGRIIEVPGRGGTGQTQYWVPAMVRGQLKIVPSDTVNFQLPNMEAAFSPLANMVPAKSAMKGQRVAMAARMITQALPLEHAESPFVQTGVPGSENESFEQQFGARMGAVRAKQGGRVLNVTPDGITVQYGDGTKDTIETAQHLPSNRKTYTHQQAMVRPGQQFAPGELLVRSNYVDQNGEAALGLNARTGWLPYRGFNFEDATVVSESFARRAGSQHMYQHAVDLDPQADRVNRKKFSGIFPGKFSKDQMEALDDDGVVRVGQRVEFGDPLVLVASQRSGRVGEISRAKATSWKDGSETWDHHSPGIVTDVAKTKRGIVVAVKAAMPLQVGDKLSGRHGNKGVIAKIVPDDEMPTGSDGRALELLYNPHGIISRSNPSQVVEAWLGKIAEKTGQKYRLQDFDDINDLVGYAQQELTKHGMKDTDDLTDPMTGRTIPGVLTGNTFVMKLHHTSESKASGRAFGSYTADGAPAKGGPEGSKTWGMLHLNALLSHGATGAIKDASMVRGQRNHAYWAAVMSGRTPPDPPVPFMYQKFVNQLRAAGINPVREGTRTHLMAMTPANVNALAEDRVITSADTVDWNDDGLKPIKGGLFDETLFGGAQGNRWAKIKLAQPMLNPVMEEPARRLLGLTKQGLLDVIAGKKDILGETGPEALQKALSGINIDGEIEKAKHDMRYGRTTARDAAVRKIGYLLGAKKTGVHPKDWLWDAVPVMPPQFRPVSKMKGSDAPMVADANYLYRDLFETNKQLEQNAKDFDDASEERVALYTAMKAVTGLGDPAPERLQEQEVKGVLKHIFGSSPKYGMVQRRLLGSTTDLVGRSTIIPNPDLDMDAVGIPEGQAWKVYQPFVVRHLVKRGMSPMRAAAMVAGQHDVARQALLSVMEERPVIIDRAPVLHRYGVMAFKPRLTKGHNLETSPVVIKGFGGDYDGDAMQFHVPATEKAVEDALTKMLPSRNLFGVADFQPVYGPSQEYLGGLYAGSTSRSNKPAVRFARRSDAVAAFKRGLIALDQVIDIQDEKG